MSPSSPLPDEETQAFEASGDRSPNRSGDLIDARYDLKEAIGGGVISTSWRAHDRVLGRDVAVKLWNDDSADAVHSQQEELAAARQINPNLNEVLDAGRHRGRPYLVSELHDRPTSAAPRSAKRTQTAPPAAVREPSTLRSSTPPTGQPAFRRKRVDRTVGIVVVTLIVAVILVAVGVIGPPGSDRGNGAAGDAVPVAPASVASFDPEGDGAENPGEVGAAVDGNPATAWTTDRYKSRRFGNLKPGLGLVFTLPAERSLHSLQIDTAEGGWAAQIHGAAAPAASLAEWGEAIAQVSEAGASESFDLQGRTVGAVLIWFTDLGGNTNRLTVSEVRLLARA